jgi:hemin uptake protein HemP
MVTPELPKMQASAPDGGAHTAGLPGLPETAKVKSEELLRGRGELVIVHQGREYRLRVTQNGKLILTA